MKTAIIIQARVTSTRLPLKVLKELCGQSVLERIITNLYPLTDNIILAIPDNNENNVLYEEFRNKVRVFRGDENDVLKRYMDCAHYYGIENVVRVCSDNPFIQTEFAAEIVNHIEKGKYDYVSYYKDDLNAILTPYGFFCEAFTMSAAEKAYAETDNVNREHVSMYFYGNEDMFHIRKLHIPNFISNRNDIRFTLDTEEDYNIYQQICSIKPADYHSAEKLIEIVDTMPDISAGMKENIARNQKNFIRK